MNLQLSRTHILRYWAGTPDQHRQTNGLYRWMRIGGAQHELSRNNGESFLAPGYACVPRAEWLRRYPTWCSPKEPTFGTRATMGCGGFEKSARVRRRMEYTWSDFLDDPGPIKIPPPPARYTSTGAVRGSWCLQVHEASAYLRGIQRNVDESRGAAVVI